MQFATRRTGWLYLFGVLFTVGCGSSDSTPVAQPTGTQQTGEQAASSRTPEEQATIDASMALGPAEVAAQFMQAMKAGDEKTAAKLLTEQSQKEIERTGSPVMQSGSPAMQFIVGEAKQNPLTPVVAYVPATLHDVGEDGQPTSEEVAWALRREASGWRIGGMMIKPFPDQPEVLLSFEDQDDLARQQELVEKEMERRNLAESARAQQPADNGTITK
ncbi:MAG: hypothetical protein SGJ20_20050 [Planctomycetota bacterium]|nr:hypothetical protein [Planctomycetota bacterium]